VAVINTGATPINETHFLVTFIENGTMSVPNTGRTISMTYNDHVIISPIPGDPTTINASGRLSFTIYLMAHSIVDIVKYGMNLASHKVECV
jgi:anthranilate/para-aminobenzoate synthase component II